MRKSVPNLMSFEIPKTHFKARGIQTDNPGTYASGLAERAHVPDNQVPWIHYMRDYKPTPFTHAAVLAQPIWADPTNVKQITDFNKGSRSSHHGHYEIDAETNLPKNPVGRTGITERGLLGKWGPNHAADPLVTRW